MKTFRPHLLALAAALSFPAVAGEVRFTLQRVFVQTTYTPPALSLANGINDSGDIAGTNVRLPSGASAAFIFAGGRYVEVSNPSLLWSGAVAMADNGRLFGTFDPFGPNASPFVYTLAGGVSFVPKPASVRLRAVDMDRTGEWLLARQVNSDASYIGRVGGTLALAPYEGATAINRFGDYVGADQTGGYVVRGGVRRDFAGTTDLSFASINSSGHAVGQMKVGGVFRPVFFDGSTLVELPAGEGSPVQISDSGIIVGDRPASSLPYAFDPRTGEQSLNELVLGLNGDVLSGAAGVNDHGQITGTASAGGVPYSYILTPTGTLRWEGGANGSFSSGASWDSRVGLMPSKFVDVVFAPAAASTALADRPATMKSLVIGASSGASTARLALSGGARLESTAAPVAIERSGVVTGSGVLAGPGVVVNRGTIGEPGGQAVDLRIEGGVENRGLVTGRGTLSGDLVNRSGGVGVRVEAGDSLSFTGGLHTNADGGRMAVRAGAELSFSGAFSNQGGATLSLDGGTLRSTAFSNGGVVEVGAGRANVIGDVANSAATSPVRGRIRAASGAELTFADRVNNLGEISAAAGASIVYRGAVTGRGSFITEGDGRHRFEGGFEPAGQSAITLGNAAFAGAVTMSIAGTAAGTAHDRLDFGGSVLFDAGSRLSVTLAGGFVPALGQSFQLFGYTQPAQGQFDGFELPALNADWVWDTSAIYSSGVLSVTAVPEPQSWALMLAGGVAVCGWLRRRHGHEA
jgi:hypothetical protein